MYTNNDIWICIDCRNDNTLYACVSGQCLPQGLKCDGIPHCDDGSDEIQLCGESGKPIYCTYHLVKVVHHYHTLCRGEQLLGLICMVCFAKEINPL